MNTRVPLSPSASRSPGLIIERRRELGERIADLRAAAHHTRDCLCEATGLSRSTLQRIESGQADPRYGDLLKIATTLGTRVSVLVDVRGETPPIRHGGSRRAGPA